MTKTKADNKAKEQDERVDRSEAEEESRDAASDDRADAKEDVSDTEETASDSKEDDDSETKYLRLAADFQNYKRRTEKERFERYADGKRDFAEDLLPVIDNFERAIAQDISENADTKFLEGMELIYQQFIGVLEKNDVKEIEAIGTEFDPGVHHAVMQEQAEGYESGTVTEVLQKGYQIKDRVIRPAMVKVAE